MKGLILSGGRGSRLRPLTNTQAKQLMPVANRPVLHYAIEALTAAGITDIGIIVGDTADKIRASVGDGAKFGARVTYISQDAPLGLAHAVRVARAFVGDEPFIMYLGDNLIRDELTPIASEFVRSDAAAMVLLAHVRNADRLGVAELDGDRIVRVVEKPLTPPTDLAVVGVFLLTSKIFSAIDRIAPSARGELEITDALQRVIDDGDTVTGRVISGWWKDTGRAGDMLEANRIMLDCLPSVFAPPVQRDDVHIEGKVHLGSNSRLRNCIIRGPIVIGTDVVIEDAYIGPYTAIQDACVIRNAEIEHSIIMGGTVIENVSHKITDSLIGRECVVRGSVLRPHGRKFVLGDQSSVTFDD